MIRRLYCNPFHCIAFGTLWMYTHCVCAVCSHCTDDRMNDNDVQYGVIFADIRLESRHKQLVECGRHIAADRSHHISPELCDLIPADGLNADAIRLAEVNSIDGNFAISTERSFLILVAANASDHWLLQRVPFNFQFSTCYGLVCVFVHDWIIALHQKIIMAHDY